MYYSALQILIQPLSVALMSGHNLRLSCHAVGKGPVEYQWFKSKQEVSYDSPVHGQPKLNKYKLGIVWPRFLMLCFYLLLYITLATRKSTVE